MYVNHKNVVSFVLFVQSDVQWEVFNNPGKSVRLLRVGYDTHKIFGVSVQRKGGSTTGLTYPKCYYLLQNSVDRK